MHGLRTLLYSIVSSPSRCEVHSHILCSYQMLCQLPDMLVVSLHSNQPIDQSHTGPSQVCTVVISLLLLCFVCCHIAQGPSNVNDLRFTLFWSAHGKPTSICPDGPHMLMRLIVQEDTKDRGWWEWQNEEIRKRHPAAIAQAIATHKDDIERFIALQFLFDRQWKAIKVRLWLLPLTPQTSQ